MTKRDDERRAAPRHPGRAGRGAAAGSGRPAGGRRFAGLSRPPRHRREAAEDHAPARLAPLPERRPAGMGSCLRRPLRNGAASRRSLALGPGSHSASLHAPGKAADGIGARSLNRAFPEACNAAKRSGRLSGTQRKTCEAPLTSFFHRGGTTTNAFSASRSPLPLNRNLRAHLHRPPARNSEIPAGVVR